VTYKNTDPVVKYMEARTKPANAGIVSARQEPLERKFPNVKRDAKLGLPYPKRTPNVPRSLSPTPTPRMQWTSPVRCLGGVHFRLPGMQLDTSHASLKGLVDRCGD
jgi:hypothetical protein